MARIFFMHIAKTAGSSANKYLLEQYPVRKSVTHAERFVTDLDRDFLLKYNLFSGHININIISRFDNPQLFEYVTFVREPVAQLTSHLKWMKRQSIDEKFAELLVAHPHVKKLSEKINDLDLSDPKVLSTFFHELEPEELAYFDNCQMRYFVPGMKGERVRQGHCNKAIEKMLQSFRFVGISEEFDKSLAALSMIYGFRSPKEEFQENVSQMDELYDINDPRIYNILRACTKFDRQLYYRALQRFEQYCINLKVKD